MSPASVPPPLPLSAESWESLTAGSMQLLKGTSIYVVGGSTKINQKVARELAIGLGVAEEGFDAVAEAESSVLESLSSCVWAVVAMLGQGTAGRADKWLHLYAGFTVWFSQTDAIVQIKYIADEDSVKEEAHRHIKDGQLAYTNADLVVKLQG